MNQQQDELSQAAEELIQNVTEAEELHAPAEEVQQAETAEPVEGKIFKKFAIKDIVFLAIMTACMLITGAIMPLLVHAPVFGIIQMGLGVQFSLFPVIGMMKVRKPGALIFISVIMGCILAAMFWPMAPCIVISGLVAEGVVLAVFRGYKSDWACVAAGTLYIPCTLPVLYVFLRFVWVSDGGSHEAIDAYLNAGAGFITGITFAVIAICFVGALAGKIISRELIKAGKFKK